MNKKNIDNDKFSYKEIKKQKLLFVKNAFNFNYPNNFFPNTSVTEIIKNYKDIDNNKLNLLIIKIAGRITSIRIMSKNSIFFNIEDEEENLQIYMNKKFVNNTTFELFHNLDLGDIVGVRGFLFFTKTKELTLRCNKIYLLNKILGNFYKKYYGLNNKSIRTKKRYLDLLINKNSRILFKQRSNIIFMIRKFMHENKFIEVETPILQNIPGGALAKPFITYHNYLNKKLYLRIAPELFLKKLVVGGFKKIFELNKNFRNEGISSLHNPEFTMMEFYIAYADYKFIMNFSEKLINTLVRLIYDDDINIKYQNYILNFKLPFKKISMFEAILEHIPYFTSQFDFKNNKKIKTIADILNIKYNPNWSNYLIINEIFEKTIIKQIIQPTFITHYPIEISPLAKEDNSDFNLSERCELFIAGNEIGNGFSELNDPSVQEKRFNKQIELNNNKDYDKDYIHALEYGLPPAGGFGLGIDRLIMILTNKSNIRDVILFPIYETV